MKNIEVPTVLFTSPEMDSLIKSVENRLEKFQEVELQGYEYLKQFYPYIKDGKYRELVKDPYSDKDISVAECVTQIKINLANVKKNQFFLSKAHTKLLLIRDYAEQS